MEFDVMTIFPDIFKSYFKESILKKAEKKGLLKIKVLNLRRFAENKRGSIDDRPFGGGRGMVIGVGPVYRSLSALAKSKTRKEKSKIVLFTPRGKRFNQKKAVEWSRLDRLIFICGRYEGLDERISKHIADERISMGNYVMMGGEIPAIAAIEAVGRLLPGVLGKSELLRERITPKGGFIEYPQYTRPEVFETKDGKKWKVPKILLSGNHKEIEKWRERHSRTIE